jgi:hypothetical protein
VAVDVGEPQPRAEVRPGYMAAGLPAQQQAGHPMDMESSGLGAAQVHIHRVGPVACGR